MFIRSRRTLLLTITGLSLAAGCAAESTLDYDFGGGKADFLELEFDLPCLDARGHGTDTTEFGLSGAGPFKISLTQPDVASSDRAVARIRIDDGQRDETTESSNTPSLEWTPDDPGTVTYRVTIFNRSTTRSLCAHLAIEEVGAFAPPTARRTFARGLELSPDLGSVPVAFFDADSTLRISRAGTPSPNTPDDVMLLPGVVTGVRAAVDRGELVVIVSNQGGVEAGFLTVEQAQAALARTAGLLAAKGARVAYFDFAETHDDNRKPGTGMAERLETNLQETLGIAVDWDASHMVGDAAWKRNVDVEPDGTPGEDFSNSDRLFAEALDIEFSHPRDYMGWIEVGVRNFHTPEEVEAFVEEHPDFGD